MPDGAVRPMDLAGAGLSCRLTALGVVLLLGMVALLDVSGRATPPCSDVERSGFVEWLADWWLPTLDIHIVEIEVNSCADDRHATTEDWVRITSFSPHRAHIGGWFIRSYSHAPAAEGEPERSDPAPPGTALEQGESHTFRRAGFWLTNLTTYALELVSVFSICGESHLERVVDEASKPEGFQDPYNDGGTWVLGGADGDEWRYVESTAPCPETPTHSTPP